MVEAVLTASRVMVALAARSVAETGEEVTLTQYRSLVVLASRGPQPLAALAEAVAVTPSTASRLVDRLVGKGLVARHRDRTDRRQVRLALTATGRALVDRVTATRRREIDALLAAVDPEARTDMVAGLEQLARAAGEVPDQEWSTGWTV